ncbi:MAG TPA: glycerol-3-phosphate acyltransferase [Dehalococcoidia bacterium]|nr:glycerol-3-phosphate acyltransferase [Dehalococcoidia bacterium]
MIEAVLIVAGSYLIGAVPVAWLTGRLLRGIDIRYVGSQNVGASNVWQTVSKAAVVPVGLAEIAQGMAGVLIAKGLGHGEGTQALAGLAAIAGHNWSPVLGFRGGRGVGHSLGFMLALSWPALAAFIVLSLTGVALRQIPLFVGLGMLAAPFAALALGQSREVALGLAGMAALIAIKRLLANHPPPADLDPREVYVYRLLFDRDVRSREEWVRRGVE